jgi:hypothetical protein
MEVVIRKYSDKNSAALFDLLEKRKSEVEPLMRSIPGLVSYTLARGGTGGFSVTICQDKAGVDESVRRAKDWIAKHAASIAAGAPEVSVGTVISHVK